MLFKDQILENQNQTQTKDSHSDIRHWFRRRIAFDGSENSSEGDLTESSELVSMTVSWRMSRRCRNYY